MTYGWRPGGLHPAIGFDNLAVGVLLEASERGIRVPEDMSVTGFGDIDLARQLRPSLTTMAVDTNRIGRMAAAYIVARIGGSDATPPDPIEPVFHRHASTGAAPCAVSGLISHNGT